MSPFSIERLTNAAVVDRKGQELGKVIDVYVDRLTGQPGWLLVETAHGGEEQAFVPLARAIAHGGAIQVPYTSEQVTDAPRIHPDAELSLEEQDRLYEHYDLAFATGRSRAGGVAEDSPDAAHGGQAAVEGDDDMTCSQAERRRPPAWPRIVGESLLCTCACSPAMWVGHDALAVPNATS